MGTISDIFQTVLDFERELIKKTEQQRQQRLERIKDLLSKIESIDKE